LALRGQELETLVQFGDCLPVHAWRAHRIEKRRAFSALVKTRIPNTDPHSVETSDRGSRTRSAADFSCVLNSGPSGTRRAKTRFKRDLWHTKGGDWLPPGASRSLSASQTAGHEARSPHGHLRDQCYPTGLTSTKGRCGPVAARLPRSTMTHVANALFTKQTNVGNG